MERGARCFLAQAVGEQPQGNLTCFPACCCRAGHEDTVVCHHARQGFPGSWLPSAAKCHCGVSLQLGLDSPFVFTWQNFSRKIEKSPLVAQAIVSREWSPLPPFPSSPWWGRPKANGLRWGRPLEGKDPAPRRDGRAVLSQSLTLSVHCLACQEAAGGCSSCKRWCFWSSGARCFSLTQPYKFSAFYENERALCLSVRRLGWWVRGFTVQLPNGVRAFQMFPVRFGLNNLPE